MSQDEYPGTFKEGTETLTALIRETFDHFQSAGSARKWWEVPGGGRKCAEVHFWKPSAYFWKQKWP